MKKYKRIYSFCFLVFALFHSAIAFSLPSDSTNNHDKKNPLRFKKYIFATDYGSASEFYGRKSGEQSYISPSFFFKGRNGIRSGVIGNYTPGTSQPYDGLTALQGWKFNLNKDWDLILDYTHTWSSAESSRLSSVLNNSLSLATDYDFDIVDIYLSANYFYTSLNRRQRRMSSTAAKTAARAVNDYSFEAAISHNFEFDNINKSKTDFCIIPEVSVAYGTQNFVVAYEKQVKKDTLVSAKTEVSASRADVLDYKFALGFIYYFGRFSIEQDLSYYTPLNQLPEQSGADFIIYTFSIDYTLKSKGKARKRK